MRRPQANRLQILKTIRAAPGLHLAELARRTNLSYGGASHHLRDLEKEGLVASARVARRRLYFAPDTPDATVAQFRALAPTAAARVARVILDEPKLTIRELALRTALLRRVVYHHVAKLRAVGLVVASGEPMRLAPAADLRAILGAQ